MKFLPNANLSEKIFLTGTISLSVLFMGYTLFKKQTGASGQDMFKSRQALLKNKDVRLLYSTLSFFNLQGFKSMEPNSFLTLARLMQLEPPHYVAIPLCEAEYADKHQKALAHPRFRQAMDAFLHSCNTQKIQQIMSSKDFSLKNLQMLMLIDHCRSVKKCQVVYTRRSTKQYFAIDQALKKLPAERREKGIDSRKVQIEDYVDIMLEKMKPKLNISFSFEPPFKNIIGVVEQDQLDELTERWKMKFKESYGHVVMEDQYAVIERQEQAKRVVEEQKQKKFAKA